MANAVAPRNNTRLLPLPRFEQAVELLYSDSGSGAMSPERADAMDVILDKLEQTRTVEQMRRLLGETGQLMAVAVEKDEQTRLVEACLAAEDKIQ